MRISAKFLMTNVHVCERLKWVESSPSWFPKRDQDNAASLRLGLHRLRMACRADSVLLQQVDRQGLPRNVVVSIEPVTSRYDAQHTI